MAALQSYIRTCKVCTFQSLAQGEIANFERLEQEARTYSTARGSISGLQAYLSSCQACTYQSEARAEITRLRIDEDERMYRQARGDLHALRRYINMCEICNNKAAALEEISRLQTPEPRRRMGSLMLCGQLVDYMVDATGLVEPYRSFVGVWTGAAWNTTICGSLIVHAVETDGTARIEYVYGPLPGKNFRWRKQQQVANIRHGELMFTDEEGGRFFFRLTDQRTLAGRFVSVNGSALNALLTKEPSSTP